jgi:hypothetical protein
MVKKHRREKELFTTNKLKCTDEKKPFKTQW